MRKHSLLLVLLLGLSCLPICIKALQSSAVFSQLNKAKAGTGGRITVRPANRGNPAVNLQDGVELPPADSVAVEIHQAFKEGLAQPCALDSADFDEDGMPDLILGYSRPGGGLLSLYRGNLGSVYTNHAQAQQQKAINGQEVSAFLSPPRLIELAHTPDFLAAGDFNADGHWDIVAAARSSKSLHLFAGNGHGDFAAAGEITLPGTVTSLVSEEVNRADGLADIIIGVGADDGPKVMVFEGPEGAFKSKPEVFSTDSEVKSLALGRFDDDYLIDLAVAAGCELTTFYGRDRRLSLDEQRHAEVLPPRISHEKFAFEIDSIAAGDFTGTNQTSLALLSSDGTVYLIGGKAARNEDHKTNKSERNETAGIHVLGRWLGSTHLLATRISVNSADDLLMLDRSSRQLHLVTGAKSEKTGSASLSTSATFDTEGAPIAALSMRLNADALSDLVILQSGHNAPTVLKTAPAMTFTVNTADDHDDGVCDSGDCTLREAITAANLNAGADTIAFAIGSGVQTIILSTDLPFINDPITIDGTTQPGFAGSPLIEINGINADNNHSGLAITAGNSTVRGLVLNRFNIAAVDLSTKGNNRVEGNYIGTNIAGTAPLFNGIGVAVTINGNTIGGTVAAARNLISGNGEGGVRFINQDANGNKVQGNYIGTDVTGTARITQDNGVTTGGNTNNIIGGTEPGAGNLISGNNNLGIELGGFGGHIVQGNLIGTNAAGTAAVGNTGPGIEIDNQPGITIGGTTPAARNVISGNITSGIHITETSSRNNLVQGNYIGVAIDGVTPLPNCTFVAGSSRGGVFINRGSDNTIGGTASGAGNVIAFNGEVGVLVADLPGFVVNTGNRISRNSIFSNNGPGIDLTSSSIGVTANDPCDPDVGPNNYQNFPVLTSAEINGSILTVEGTLNSTANGAYAIEFFENSNCDLSGNGEGRTYLGSTTVTTDGSCNGSFTFMVAAPELLGGLITATATDGAGNTSEFSQCRQVGPACTYSISSSSQFFSSRGGTGAVNISTSPGCRWAVTLEVSWITLTSPAIGSGSDIITFEVRENLTALPRQGVISIATERLTITQEKGSGPTCSLFISPTSQTFSAAGGAGMFDVFASSSCVWRVTSNVSWITISGDGLVSGFDTVMYTVAPNPSGISRSGVIRVGGRSFSVKQTGS
jgi:CSLREA domain-containing protein